MSPSEPTLMQVEELATNFKRLLSSIRFKQQQEQQQLEQNRYLCDLLQCYKSFTLSHSQALFSPEIQPFRKVVSLVCYSEQFQSIITCPSSF